MPNIETVRALVSAFNVHNYARDTVKTNFKLQSEGKKDYIVVSFDKGMKDYQCSEYLDSIKRKIIREFYGISNDAEILDTAKLIFDVNSFPFNMKGKWSQDEQGRIEFLAPIDKGVIFNLKSHLASSLKKDILEDMQVSSIAVPFNKKKYLWCGEFDNKELCKQFEHEFLSRMSKRRYDNVPSDLLKDKDNSVYIRDVFDDARFIDSVTRYKAWLTGMDLGVGNDVDHSVMLLKDSIINSVYQSTKIIVVGFVCASPLGRKEASILLPLVLDGGRKQILTNEEALKLNCAFNYTVFNDLYGRTRGELSVDGRNGIYGIDFSNPEISHCVITKIIESSVINKDHELSIDPELRLQALSPAQSPVRVPNGPSSGLTGTSTQGFPTRSQGGALKESARQGSETEKGLLLYNQLNVAVAGPSARMSSIVVNPGISGPSSQSLSAAQNVSAAWSHDPWSLQSTSGNKWQPPPEPGPSGLSWKGAAANVPAGTSDRAQQPNRWSFQAPSAGPSLLQPSRPLSRKGANPVGANPWTQQPNRWSLQSSNLKEDCKKICEDFEEAYEKIESDSSLSKEEQELSEALLYWFNLNNFIMECPHTNFIVKNGKIASLINDGVDREKYLQAVGDYTIKEYYVTEKEACDLNEFPFKFLSNCEKNQETTVVANISRDALFNLKKLFIQEQKPKKKVKIEDINIDIVETAVKSKRKGWVDSQVREHGFPLKAAIESCYPDESVLKHISIIKDKGGYQIDHAYDSSEVKSLKKQLCTKGKSKAEKMKSEDNKDSGISSGEATDAENVSSKAKAITSGYESMDCENTRGGLPKRKSPSPEDGGNPRKSPKRDSLPLSSLRSLSLSSSSHQIGKC